MTILHVLSQYEVNGAETYAATLADESVQSGHRVIIVSDTFHTATRALVINQPLGKRSYPWRIKNIAFLSSLIRKEKIDIVHAHSRAAAWVAYFATRLTNKPLVSSIHMRQHIHFTSKHFSVYGEKLVAVCGAIYEHLIQEMNYSPKQVITIPNGIDLNRWVYRLKQQRQKKQIAIVGRFTGFKGDSLIVLLNKAVPQIVAQTPDVEISIVGGMSEREKVEREVASINSQLRKNCISIRGFTTDIEKVYSSVDLVIGAGRVAMEALACGTPVVAAGESNVVGLISPSTAQEALYSNFGDLARRRELDIRRCVDDAVAVLRNPAVVDTQWARRFVEEHFDSRLVSRRMHQLYKTITSPLSSQALPSQRT